MGKVALARDWCKKHKEFEHIHLVAREVMKDHGISREDMEASLKSPDNQTFLQLQHLILEEQNRREIELGDSPLSWAESNSFCHYLCEQRSS